MGTRLSLQARDELNNGLLQVSAQNIPEPLASGGLMRRLRRCRVVEKARAALGSVAALNLTAT
jgi:hypothetical protein